MKKSKNAPLNVEPLLLSRWFSIIVVVSVILILVTFASYSLKGNGLLSTVLFKIGLGGENNFGAWWSGMLLLLGAVLAFDGYRLYDRSVHQRRGWLALAFILLILSFDEVAALQEGMHIVPYAAVGLTMLGFAVIELIVGHTDRRAVVLILVSFGLFGTIAIQEYFQHALIYAYPMVQ